MKVVVVGSLNVDYLASVDRLPGPGETVPANGLVKRFGGKGANQALAAARQGARVSLLGCVGADDDGRAYCRRLRAEGIDCSGISATSRALTGTALIAVDTAAENTIVVAAGANGQLKPAALRAQQRVIAAADVLLLQLEIPMPSAIEAVRLANRAGVGVMLNPSPLRDGFPWKKCQVDTLIANAGEAEEIFGLKVAKLPRSLSVWQRALGARRVARLLITRGAKPTICLSGTECFQVPTLRVKPLDTVGAGDAFAGTFAARRAEGRDVASAIRYANCAGALATLKAGAQESIPSQAATERALRQVSPGG